MSEVKVNKISPRTNCGTTQLGDAGDTITVTGDLKSNSLKSASGSTITLGQSGDTIQLGCGASQTGFGRTGTVDWDTTAKTASFTAVSGNGYFVNTTSGAVTMTLPATPSAGDIVSVKDYAYTFATNNLTVAPNGSNIGGAGSVSVVYDVNGTSKTFIYVDGTQGWLVTNESTDTSVGENFIVATGGTVTTCGNCRIHTFTGPGTFCVSAISGTPANNEVSYIVVAGGGAGGSSGGYGAGGGAGGYREVKTPITPYTASPLCGYATPGNRITVTATAFPITVGGGGALQPGPPWPNSAVPGQTGSNSIFSTITSAGGGGGLNDSPGSSGNGGSGGGNRNDGAGGTGNTPPVTPPQGNNGGSSPNPSASSGGGGGATAVGGTGSSSGGAGGAGATTSISASPTAYAGGGGGAGCTGGGSGGVGGGGQGEHYPNQVNATAGTANTGGGGGGGNADTPPRGGAGGSGIVIIRYKYQ